jgi:hypothetical protein
MAVINREDCPRADKCDAPLCPLENNEGRVWYPTESICKYTRFANSPLVKSQKKIAKRCADKSKVYTYKMLNRQFLVRQCIDGLDPDKDLEKQEKAWLGKHQAYTKYQLKKMAYEWYQKQEK